ncbi:MAG: flagellar motor switch protein FliN [Magnetococcus sp. WYHC-3]
MADNMFSDDGQDSQSGAEGQDLYRDLDRKSMFETSLAAIEGGHAAIPKNLELLLDVPLNVSVRLGGVRMQIRDLLKLNKGSLIELEKEADEPLEIHVNDRLLAYGEVVMIKDKLGIRITDIVSLSERLENLRT